MWDAEKWLETRDDLIQSGNWDVFRELLSMVGRSTNEAIRLGKYYLPPPDGEVALKEIACCNPVSQWYGASNVNFPETGGGEPPPLICTTEAPMKVVAFLKEHFDNMHVCFSVDVTDFDMDGTRLRGMDAKNQIQQDLFLRTDFEKFVEDAARQSVKATMRDHLTAPNDPFVFAARNVTIFRGPVEEGYNFLAEPLQLDVIVSARSTERPDILVSKEEVKGKKVSEEVKKIPVLDSRGEQVEFFAAQQAFSALMERLNLIGLVALEGHDGGKKPLLVLSATNLRLLPRHGIARALKHWRSIYASFFDAIVVACGDDKNTAELFDEVINSDVYEAGVLPRDQDSVLLELSVNPDLADLDAPSDDEEDVVVMPSPGGRRFSIAATMNLVAAPVEAPAPPPMDEMEIKNKRYRELSQSEKKATTTSLDDSDEDSGLDDSDEDESVVSPKSSIDALPALDNENQRGKGYPDPDMLLDEVQSLALSVQGQLQRRKSLDPPEKRQAQLDQRRKSTGLIDERRSSRLSDHPLNPLGINLVGRRRNTVR